MKPLPLTPQLIAVARRVVWYKEPEAALRDPVHFLAHVMTYGNVDDIVVVENLIGDDALLEALRKAPPGVFDARSWSYWNLKLGRTPVPPLPDRKFGSGN
jgi:hypothetical protein